MADILKISRTNAIWYFEMDGPLNRVRMYDVLDSGLLAATPLALLFPVYEQVVEGIAHAQRLAFGDSAFLKMKYHVHDQQIPPDADPAYASYWLDFLVTVDLK